MNTTLIKTKRVKDLDVGDVFVFCWIEWRVTKKLDRLYYCRNEEGGGWCDSFGINSMMKVQYLGKRLDKRKTKKT
jgi:hypothetical protein